MIPYHGTPIGGDRLSPANFLQGRHALVPFARPDDLGIVMEVCQSFIFDCSAYSIWLAGQGQVDFDAYMDWVRHNYRHPGFDFAIIPDVIDGAEEENSRLIHRWLRCGPRFKGVPVWHLHESLEWLEYLVTNFEHVAIGSSGQWRTPGTPAWWARMAELRGSVCDAQGRPKCKLHGLRMLDPDIFTRLPFHSADSTNAAVNCGSLSRFGSYLPPTAAQRATVIGNRIEANNGASVWLPAAVQQHIELRSADA